MGLICYSARVSLPEPLELVRAAHWAQKESALVVPELSVQRRLYFRALVDQENMLEHAIFWEREEERTPAQERLLCQRVLSLRRPHEVSWLEQAGEQLWSIEGSERDPLGSCCMAAVLVAEERGKEQERLLMLSADRVWQVSIARERQIWFCEVEPGALPLR